MSTVQIGWGQVRHTRFRTAHHAFQVQAFFVRLNMRQLEGHPNNGWFSTGPTRALFSFRASDYGTRKGIASIGGLLENMQELLSTHGVHHADGEVFLHTFPRIFGFVFNPVSFWFFHTRSGELCAVVCEVNNTFGERHFYVLNHEDGTPLKQGEELKARKEFHVSPFFDVRGRYRFRFFNIQNRSVARIDYDEPEGHSLATSISGELADATPDLWKKTLLKYKWYTVGVVVKIHWQALFLWIKGVPFFSKPEPPQQLATRSNKS